MIKALSGALLLSLVPLSSTLAAADCPVRHAPGTEVAGSAGQCPAAAAKVHGPPLRSPWLNSAADPVAAYAIQIAEEQEGVVTVPRGLYRFDFPDFSSAQRLAEDDGDLADDLADTYGLAFNPAASRLYMIRDMGAGSPALMRLALDEPEVEPVAFIDGFSIPSLRNKVTGLAIHPRTGEGWMVSYHQHTNNPPLNDMRLWRVDLQTGSTIFAGPLLADQDNPVLVDIAIDCNGDMYAHNISDDSLYHIDTGDLSVTRIGSHGLPANFNQSLAFDNRDGTLYGWIYTGGGNNQFGSFNLANGAFDVLVQNDPPGQWNGAIASRCPALAIDDPGVFQGAWYDPVSNGQGFALNWMPDSHTLFMPWFTFAPAVPDDEEDEDEVDLNSLLRWHVLHGNWSPGQGEVTLPIYEVTNGRFDEGVPVDQRPVGEATLRFVACDVGILDYSFDSGENQGLAGAINLTRLLPRSGPCREAAGHTVPAGGAYDPLMSGVWYDPASEGQGLSLFRIAPDPEVETDTGMFYGAWFTFDPELPPPGDDDEGGGDGDGDGDGDDDQGPGPVPEGPAAQQWFTFGGQEVDEDGVVTVPIHLTVGGTFDGAAAFVPRIAGEATLTSTACDRLTLAYEFADTAAMGRFRGLEGEIALQRLGPCPAAE